MNGRSQEELEDLVAECAERIDREGLDALERLCREHPGHEAGLRAAIGPLLAYGVTGARTAEPVRAAAAMPQRLGEFLVQREIGRGGMGVVYEALQPALHRRVAIKVLPAGHFPDERHLMRFQNEARAAATLDHPNIVPVHYVGQTDGHHWYAMHLVAGTSLRRLLAWLGGDETDAEAAVVAAGLLGTAVGQRPPVLPSSWFPTAADLARQAAEALAKAHAVGVLHRDIKPGNLLVEASGHLWIADFGLAHFEREDSDLTRTGEFVGTLAYSSPERLSAHTAADARSDVYSLGATLYELLVLRPPFAGQAPQLMRQVLDVDPPAPHALDPRVPVDLDTIVRTAMAKEPTTRYQSAGALAADLRAFLAGRPIAARPISRQQRLLRWCQRNPALATAGGAVLGLAALLLAVAFVTVRTAHERDRAVQAEATVSALSNRRTFDARVEAVRARCQDLRAGRHAEATRLLIEARDAIAAATSDPAERALMRMRLCTEAIADACQWDAEEGPLFAVVQGLRPLAVDGSETHMAAAGGGELRIATTDGTVVARLSGPTRVSGVRFCRDDAWLAFVGDDALLAWHWPSDRQIRVPGGTTAPHICSTREHLFAVVDGELTAIDLASGAATPALPQAIRTTWPTADVRALQCSADGRVLAISCVGKAQITVFERGERPSRREIALPDDAWQIAIDGDGAHALVGGRFLDVLSLDLAQGTVAARFAGHHAEVAGLAASADGSLFATSGWDAQMLLWNPQGRAVLSLPTPRPVPEVRFADDGRAVGWSPTTGDLRGATHWRLQPPTAVHAIPLPGRAHTGKPELTQHPHLPIAALATRDGITLLAAGTWTPLATLAMTAPPVDLVFRSDGDLVVAFGGQAPPQILPVHAEDGTIIVGPARTFAHVPAFANLAIAGNHIVGRTNGSLQVIDTDARGMRSIAADVPSAADLELSPDGRFAAVGVFPAGEAAVVFDVATGERVFQVPTCERMAFARFSPDGRRVVFSRRDAFWVYEVGTWQRLGVIQRPQTAATAGHCAWSPDGRLLVVPIEPARLQVLAAESLSPLFELEVPDGAPAGEPVFAADGCSLLLPSIHCTLFAWDLAAIARELTALDLAWPGAPAATAAATEAPLPRIELRR